MLTKGECNVLTDGHTVEESGILKNKAEALPQIRHVPIIKFLDVLAVEDDAAGGWTQQADEGFEEHRFATTAFANDRESHLNETSWFEPPLMYGFEFRNARPIQYTPVKGQTLFFTVKGFAPQ